MLQEPTPGSGHSRGRAGGRASTTRRTQIMMARGLTVTAVGVGAGVAGALSAGRFVAPLLFEGRSPRDPLAAERLGSALN